MPVTTDRDQPEDGDEVKLTAAQREALQNSMESLRKLVLPKIDLPKFVLPESTLKSFAAISGIADQQRAILRHALKPFLDSHRARQKQVSIINSDFFKSSALAQSDLNALTGQLYRNVDFGLSGSFAKLAQQVAAQQSAWIKTLGPSLERLKLAFYPSVPASHRGAPPGGGGIGGDGGRHSSLRCAAHRNRRGAHPGGKRIQAPGDSRGADGRPSPPIAVLPLRGARPTLWLPMCPSRSKPLTRSTRDTRRRVRRSRGRSWTRWLTRTSARNVTATRPTSTASAPTWRMTNSPRMSTSRLRPIWQAWQKFFPHEGLPVPHTFSRNATAHTVSTKQYSRRNAVQGLMIVKNSAPLLRQGSTGIVAGQCDPHREHPFRRPNSGVPPPGPLPFEATTRSGSPNAATPLRRPEGPFRHQTQPTDGHARQLASAQGDERARHRQKHDPADHSGQEYAQPRMTTLEFGAGTNIPACSRHVDGSIHVCRAGCVNLHPI